MATSNRHIAGEDVCKLPLKQIEAALRKTTEVLATELAAPGATTPDWTDFEWCIARSVAAMHGVSPLLYATLRWQGPESWQRFLREQRDHTLSRHQRIARLLTAIGLHAVRNGIAIVPLKGAALHEIGIYQPGERPMSDIDLLVKSADLEATARLLDGLGYRKSFTTWKHWVFEPNATTDTIGFGEHADNPLKIELHAQVAERMPLADRDITALVFPPRPVAGLNSYPSISSMMIHLLQHAAGNMCFSGVRLLQLHDIALLSRRMTSSDWDGVLATANGQAPWWMSPPLTLTTQYYPTAIPEHVVARGNSNSSWLLRRLYRRRTLSDVSYSNLWIQAFPGIEWSRSTLEAIRWIVSRVKPDADALAARTEILKSHPSTARFDWPHLSHWQRIVRWTFDRPPRPQTLYSVHAALASLRPHPRLTPPS
jgi:hypothetical protein